MGTFSGKVALVTGDFLTTAVNDGFKRVSTTDQRATLSEFTIRTGTPA